MNTRPLTTTTLPNYSLVWPHPTFSFWPFLWFIQWEVTLFQSFLSLENKTIVIVMMVLVNLPSPTLICYFPRLCLFVQIQAQISFRMRKGIKDRKKCLEWKEITMLYFSLFAESLVPWLVIEDNNLPFYLIRYALAQILSYFVMKALVFF